MIDRAVLTAELKRLVLRTEDDLRARAAAVAEIEQIITTEWEQARLAQRTRLDAGPWRESLLTQVAVGWVLGSVFVRFCEDNGLLPTPLLSGPGERLKQAVDRQTLFFRAHPADGERAFLADVFDQVSTPARPLPCVRPPQPLPPVRPVRRRRPGHPRLLAGGGARNRRCCDAR